MNALNAQKKTHPNLNSNPKNRSPDDWNGRVRRNSLSLRDFRRYSVLRPKSKTAAKHVEKKCLTYRVFEIPMLIDSKFERWESLAG